MWRVQKGKVSQETEPGLQKPKVATACRGLHLTGAQGYRENQTTELPSQAPDGNVHKFTSNSLQPLRRLEDMIDLTFGLPRRDVLILPTSTLHFLMSSAFHHQTNTWA